MESGVANTQDPNLNVGLPVFTIHGNHDDPSGPENLSAVDLLSAVHYVNYFGKHTMTREGTDDVGKVVLSPVLLMKVLHPIPPRRQHVHCSSPSARLCQHRCRHNRRAQAQRSCEIARSNVCERNGREPVPAKTPWPTDEATSHTVQICGLAHFSLLAWTVLTHSPGAQILGSDHTLVLMRVHKTRVTSQISVHRYSCVLGSKLLCARCRWEHVDTHVWRSCRG